MPEISYKKAHILKCISQSFKHVNRNANRHRKEEVSRSLGDIISVCAGKNQRAAKNELNSKVCAKMGAEEFRDKVGGIS